VRGSAGAARGVVRGIAVGNIVRDVIAEAAPAELLIVDGLCKLSPSAARRRLRRRRLSRDPIGFGLDVVVPLLTPVVWIAVDELVRRVVDGASGSLAGRIGQVLRAVARRVTRRPRVELPTEAEVPPLSPAQLEAVRCRVLELAPKYYLTSADAEALADRVVARLMLTTTGPGAGSSLAAGAGKDPAR
jgi:hypothetical protein